MEPDDVSTAPARTRTLLPSTPIPRQVRAPQHADDLPGDDSEEFDESHLVRGYD